MKYFIYFLIVVAIVLISYNATLIDYSNILGEDSIVAVITVLAGLCSLMVLLILLVSRRIRDKANGKK